MLVVSLRRAVNSRRPLDPVDGLQQRLLELQSGVPQTVVCQGTGVLRQRNAPGEVVGIDEARDVP